ncbi:MAG: TMEM165/GDT1 family protein [Deltaproteobacteria bacterium]|jgi:putative Ca2+/H+ antiporter (TMEM165/GDT1 family)|nr:TMEM165/GDT1 family protein [Deltaproteobacteria bacterium]
MSMKIFWTVFGTVFLAELGDKTQLATMLFATDRQVDRLTIFLGASLALICTSALGVAAGGLLARHCSPRHLSRLAGLAFIVIGAWTIYRAG